jgi:hypothetical protein
LIAAVCLLLASKINDPKELQYSKLLDVYCFNQAIERVFELPRKDVYSHEFSVYSSLEFQLFLPLKDISAHMNRIVSSNSEKILPFIEENKNLQSL